MLESTGTLVPVVNFFESVTTSWKIFQRPFPYQWNPAQRKFETIGSFQKKWWLASTSVPILVGLSLSFHAVWKGHFAIDEFTVLFRFLTAHCLYGGSSILFLRNHSAEFVWILNSVLKFEELYVDSKKCGNVMKVIKQKGVSAARMLNGLRALTYIGQVTTAMSALKKPTQAYNPFCAFTNFPIGNSLGDSVIIKILAFVATVQVWYTSMVYLFTAIMIHFILINFWFHSILLVLRGIAENDVRGFGTTSGVTRFQSQMQTLAPAYRQVQLLLNRYNATHRTYIIAGFLSILMLTNISSTYILIRNGDESSPSALIGLSLNCFSTTVIMASALAHPAAVYKLGKQRDLWVKKYMAREISHKRSVRWMSRYWKSLQKLKIEYWLDNYFDAISPIAILAFCFNSVIDLVLLRM